MKIQRLLITIKNDEFSSHGFLINILNHSFRSACTATSLLSFRNGFRNSLEVSADNMGTTEQGSEVCKHKKNGAREKIFNNYRAKVVFTKSKK